MDTESSDGPPVTAALYPFDRPLWRNVVAVVLAFVLWGICFDQSVTYLAGSEAMTLDTAAARTARARGATVASFVTGAYMALITGAAYGWHIWNVLLGTVIPVATPPFIFRIREGYPQSGVYNDSGYYKDLDALVDTFPIILAFMAGFILTAWVGLKLYLNTPERKLAWLAYVPGGDDE